MILAEPLPLIDLCRRVIRKKIGKKDLKKNVNELGLPTSIVKYLKYEN